MPAGLTDWQVPTWLVSALLEVKLLNVPFKPRLAAFAALAFVDGHILRYSGIRRQRSSLTSGTFWPPDDVAVSRSDSHATRLEASGSALQVVALPLIHTAWRTAVFFGILNLISTARRARKRDGSARTPASRGEDAHHARVG